MDFGYVMMAYYPDVANADPQQIYQDDLDQVVLAEQVGFTEVSVPEHHFINFLNYPSPLVAAVAAAERTEAMRIITAVCVAPFYEPRRLAGEITLVDALTGGRVECGLGRGGFRYEFDRMGVEFDVEKQRRQFSEFVKVLDILLTETDVVFDGEFYNWDQPLTIMPRPATLPRPALHIAAVGEGGIRWATSQGFGLLTTAKIAGWELTTKMAEWFLDERAKLETDLPLPRHTLSKNLYVSKDRKDLEQKSHLLLENHRRFTALFSEAAQRSLGTKGTADAATLGDVRGGEIQPADFSMSAEEMAANVIIGDPDHVIEVLRAHAELGIDSLHANMAFGADHADVCKSIELMGSEVIPEFARATSKA